MDTYVPHHDNLDFAEIKSVKNVVTILFLDKIIKEKSCSAGWDALNFELNTDEGYSLPLQQVSSVDCETSCKITTPVAQTSSNVC